MLANKYEKKKQQGESIYKKIAQYYFCQKKRIIAGCILSAIGAILILLAPLALQQVSVIILNWTSGIAIDYNKVLAFTIGAGACYLVGAIFLYIQVYIIAGCVAHGSKKLREEMTHKFNRLPLNYFDTRNIGDVLSYVSNDVDIIGTTLNTSVSSIISAIITLIGSVCVLFYLDWRIALVVLIALPILFWILSKIGNKAQVNFLKRSELVSQVSSACEEDYTAHNIIRVMNATDAFRNKFATQNYNLQKVMDKADYYSGIMQPMMTFMSNVLLAIVAMIGGIIAAGIFKETGAGATYNTAIATVVTAVSYIENLMSPLTTIANLLANLQQTIASAQRIFAFISEEDEPDESNKTVTIPEIKGNIEFEHVKFGYTKDRIIIHDFSEKGKAGQKIAIVGPTGAGKTTMVNLLMRFYEINSGAIKIEGIDTKTMNRSYVRGLFGMVLQDTWLFEGTIMENLKYSRPDATDEEVYAACKATHCDVFIRQQPGGYDQMLGEDCGLSAGQKQLLTIARAMIQNAPMLILDEATSSVDTRTELMIQDAMDALMKGRTSFVIAHRLSTIKNSDLIIVMKDGDVIETGNHDELMKAKGFYCSLYNAQFSGNGPQFD